ncbi:LuxR C-terminal-related transcriptional regulator [Cohnella sp. WQ 127256]|uniref:LuxR C-terminal-related transcriptional regulator n=1 Tax=Cohnella sp. WQ 127256 TaxID=2938790 RepID=UPI0021173C3F|nr:LuxR C-terminal-related transcriptional regulator [Cohnella sp. WQ 127256]
MPIPILSTKLYVPPSRTNVVLRPRLNACLNEGLHRKLTLISASAGFGKTTLVSEWVAGCERPVTWLSLDEGDNDATRFLTYLIAALQTIEVNIGEGVFAMLHSPQSPPTEVILTALINEITSLPYPFVLVLDDYHMIDAKPVENAVLFLLEHLPPQMNLVITTREDPRLPLARLRVRDQLIELRVADLRFTPSEAAGFLNEVMGLSLSSQDITLLETRTEGWIAGLQLAAISMQGLKDSSNFIQTFTGSHHFVLDYLVEEVLLRQPERIQNFLLQTSILDRLCGPLCDAILPREVGEERSTGQETLEYLEHVNLFIVPLDNERRWYRYHHLFADLLRKRMHQSQSTASSTRYEGRDRVELHLRASEWYEENGLEIEAFHHATAANDVERVVRLLEGEGMPLYFRGAAAPVMKWLESQPTTVLNARPMLWVTYASVLLFNSQLTGVEQKLQAAEAALQGIEPDDKINDVVGHIASVRATVAVSQHDVDNILVQSRRALAHLHPDNLPVRTATTWTLGYAYYLLGDRAAASQAYAEALSFSQSIGHFVIIIMATMGLGNVQEVENQLEVAVQTYQSVLKFVGDSPLPVVCEAHLGLARIFYEWNDLDMAGYHEQQSLQLARQFENTDRVVASEVFHARLELAKGNAVGAAAILAMASQLVRQHNFVYVMPEVAAAQVLTFLHQGNLEEAARLAHSHELPLSQARVYLAQGDTTTSLAVLQLLRQQMEAKGWEDERLKVMVLEAVVLQAHGEMKSATQLLGDALALAEPNGFIRIFVDEGAPMAQLLSVTAARESTSKYRDKLLAGFEVEKQKSVDKTALHEASTVQFLIDPLSERELEVLQLIAQGLSNREISERLFLALSTVKGHNQIIFGKLHVQRRTEAVARARELGLL